MASTNHAFTASQHLDQDQHQSAQQDQQHQDPHQRQQHALDPTWSSTAQNATTGALDTAGNILGGAVNMTGQAVGNVGRRLGKILNDAGESAEAIGRSAVAKEAKNGSELGR